MRWPLVRIKAEEAATRCDGSGAADAGPPCMAKNGRVNSHTIPTLVRITRSPRDAAHGLNARRGLKVSQGSIIVGRRVRPPWPGSGRALCRNSDCLSSEHLQHLEDVHELFHHHAGT